MTYHHMHVDFPGEKLEHAQDRFYRLVQRCPDVVLMAGNAPTERFLYVAPHLPPTASKKHRIVIGAEWSNEEMRLNLFFRQAPASMPGEFLKKLWETTLDAFLPMKANAIIVTLHCHCGLRDAGGDRELNNFKNAS